MLNSVCNTRRARGFTLVEILITIVIFAITIGAVTRAFNAGARASSETEKINLAIKIAQTKMEEIQFTVKESGVDSLVSVDSEPDVEFSNFNVTIDAAEGQNPKTVTVTVAWQAAGGQADTALTTMVADY